MSKRPVGYLHHWSSRKLVHPRGGEFTLPGHSKGWKLWPDDDVKLSVHSDKSNPERLQFRFVPVDGAGHFGYIEHVNSGMVVQPKCGSLDPSNDTHLVLRSDRHAGALFGFDEGNGVVVHKGGKIWHPKREDPNPGDDTSLILHSDRNDAGKFYFGDLDGNAMSPYPEPHLSGNWKLLRAFIRPLADHTYSETYKIGRSKTHTNTKHHAWNVSAEVAKDFFIAKAEYSGFVEDTNTETWSEEKETSYTVNVKKGRSVWTWQYVFGMSQYGEELHFQSTIIGDTDSEDKKPVIKKQERFCVVL